MAHSPTKSSVGLRMDSESIKAAVGLRLGARSSVYWTPLSALWQPRWSIWYSWPQLPSEPGSHSLSHWAECDHPESSFIHPFSFYLGAQGLFRTDGRRPDGLSLIPWSRGHALVWDATCRDTFAPSYLHLSSAKTGAVAEEAAVAKCHQNREICATHCFIPLAFESTGVFSQVTLDFIKDQAYRTRVQSHDPLSYLKLCQRIMISVSIQRYTCVSVLRSCVRWLVLCLSFSILFLLCCKVYSWIIQKKYIYIYIHIHTYICTYRL